MTVEKLIEGLKYYVPKNVVDLFESLDLVKETIGDTLNHLDTEVTEALKNRDFETRKKLNTLIDELQELDAILTLLEIDYSVRSEESNDEIKKDIPNYEDYIVDTNVEHTLYENFQHKRPYGFMVNDDKLIKVNSWKEMNVQTCYMLYTIDKEKFHSFVDSKKMNGKKRKYFSTNSKGMRDPILIENDVYIEGHDNSNGHRNRIIKMLKQYNFSVDKYKVFLRADYTNMNQ